MRKCLYFLFIMLLVGLLVFPAMAAGKDVVAIVSGAEEQGRYGSVAEAVAAVKPGQHLKMLEDSAEELTVTGDLYLDLAGHHVSGLTVTGTVYGMDSATDDYTDEKAGSLTVNGTIAPYYATQKRYLAVEKDGSYSFHRYYMGVTAVVLAPNRSGMGYKACFAGSETVKSQLKDFGMAVSFDPLAESLADSAYRFRKADSFIAGEPFYQKLIVQNILREDAPENYDRATTQIYARCFIRLTDGTTLFSAQQGSNLLEATEKADRSWSGYTETQKTAVSNMISKYPMTVSGWGVKNAHHYDSDVWKPWTGSWTNGGHYYLTNNCVLTTTITVPAGQSLSICLNGYKLRGTASRMFRVNGTLNIHDHQDSNGDYAGEMVSTYNKAVMAPVFYVYENGTMNLCGGNISYGGTGVMTRGGVGMVGSSDGDDDNTTVEKAYFNMYSGVIRNGNVQAVLKTDGTVSGSSNGFGGNLDLVNHGYVNLYRGKILSGTATRLDSASNNGQGGNIAVGSNNVVLNLYDVEITGGNSGVYLLAGSLNLNDGVKITGNTEYNLFISSGKTVNTGALDGAAVGVTMGGSGNFTAVADASCAKYFTSDAEKLYIFHENGGLTVCHGHCVCGESAVGVADHACQGIKYQAMPAVTDLSKLSSGCYYLTGDLTVSGNTNWTKKQNVSICLNGYNIKTTTTSPFGKIMAGATLNICDCSGHKDEDGWTWEGTVYGGNKNYGGVVNFNANSAGNIYGGNFVGAEGGISGGVFNICNDGYASVTDRPAGANQYSDVYNTVFNLYNAHVQGGKVSKSGGAVNSWHKVQVNIYGGVIHGGSADVHGGNIAVAGTYRISNARIYGGTSAGDSGNIYVPANTTLYLTNTEIHGGTAITKGGNINIQSDCHVYMEDVTVTGGAAEQGGGVFNYMSTVHLSGKVVIDGNENHNLQQCVSRAIDTQGLAEGSSVGIFSDIKGRLINTEDNSGFYSEDEQFDFLSFGGNTLYLPKGSSLSYSPVSSFSAGYGVADISPTENGVPLGGYGTSSTRLSTEVDENGRLYVMTTAVTDETGNTILIVACDQIRFTDTVTNTLREHMSAATGVPAQNIYINCSHTHSVPEPTLTDDVSLRYKVLMYNGFVESAIAAMQDRRTATMQTGSFEVTGVDGTGTLNYVRHYQYTDAEGVVHYFGDNFGTAVYDSTTRHVSEADPTMFLIKFTRSGTDILLCNWRAHPHFTGGSAKTLVSSDYVGPFRDAAEDLLGDCEVVFIQGAGGNINEKSRTQLGDNHGLDYIGYGKELAKQLNKNMSCLKTVSAGKIQTKQIMFTATVDHSDDDRIDDAKAVTSAYWSLSDTERKALLAQYGFSSVYQASAISARYSMAETKEVEVNVFSIGNQVGFYTVPGELWDTAGVLVEEASPFPITVCVGYSLGDYKYFTHGIAWTYDSYESSNYRFTVPDTLNRMMEIWEAGLDELFDNA